MEARSAHSGTRGRIHRLHRPSSSRAVGHRRRRPSGRRGRRAGARPAPRPPAGDRRGRGRLRPARSASASRNALVGSAYCASALRVDLGHGEPLAPLGRFRHRPVLAGVGLDVQGPEVVVLGPEQRLLAEHLEPPARLAAQHLVPDARQLRDRAVGVAERDRGACPRCPDTRSGRGLRRRRRPGRRGRQRNDVDVVDRVLDEGAAAGVRDVPAPGRAVDALDREVLVVAHHRGEHPSVARRTRPCVRDAAEHRRPPQHEADLVRHPFERRRDTRRRGEVGRERLLAEHRAGRDRRPPRRRRGGPRSRCRSTPRRPRRAASRASRAGSPPWRRASFAARSGRRRTSRSSARRRGRRR